MNLISVIIPVYKVEPYLHRCVDSILAQTFQDFEIILVDDGSPDRCGAICDEYAALDTRIHVIHKENGGLSSARNAGIDWAFQNSDSQWLAFVDSDDWVHPRYLELLYLAATQHRVQLSVCEYLPVASMPDPFPVSLEATAVIWDVFLLEHKITGVVAWNKLYDKDLFVGLRYPYGKLHEDEFLTYKLIYRANRVSYTPATLYYYYQNPAGIMKSPFSLKRLDGLEAMEERFVFSNRHGCHELFLHDIRRYLYICTYYDTALQNAKSIPVHVRNCVRRKIRRHVRFILLRYGLFNLSLRKYRHYYLYAFPLILSPVNRIWQILKRFTRSQNQAL